VSQAEPGGGPSLSTQPRDLVPNQFGDSSLTTSEAFAACGPAAAVAFARVYGRNPTLRESLDLAKQTGWTAEGGMNGMANEGALLDKMGVAHVADYSPSIDKITSELVAGRPVIISTGRHYYVADAYDKQTGAFHVGASGTALKSGAEWMTPAQIQAQFGGDPIDGALYVGHDAPAYDQASRAATAVAAGQQNAATPVETAIRQSAVKYGVDPDVAVRVASAEGGTSDWGSPGDSGGSFGPFQLHYGHTAPGGNYVSGLGDTFTAETGLDARDPKNGSAATDWAMRYVSQHGWGPWHGAAAIGVTGMMGVNGKALPPGHEDMPFVAPRGASHENQPIDTRVPSTIGPLPPEIAWLFQDRKVEASGGGGGGFDSQTPEQQTLPSDLRWMAQSGQQEAAGRPAGQFAQPAFEVAGAGMETLGRPLQAVEGAIGSRFRGGTYGEAGQAAMRGFLGQERTSFAQILEGANPALAQKIPDATIRLLLSSIPAGPLYAEALIAAGGVSYSQAIGFGTENLIDPLVWGGGILAKARSLPAMLSNADVAGMVRRGLERTGSALSESTAEGVSRLRPTLEAHALTGGVPGEVPAAALPDIGIPLGGVAEARPAYLTEPTTSRLGAVPDTGRAFSVPSTAPDRSLPLVERAQRVLGDNSLVLAPNGEPLYFIERDQHGNWWMSDAHSEFLSARPIAFGEAKQYLADARNTGMTEISTGLKRTDLMPDRTGMLLGPEGGRPRPARAPYNLDVQEEPRVLHPDPYNNPFEVRPTFEQRMRSIAEQPAPYEARAAQPEAQAMDAAKADIAALVGRGETEQVARQRVFDAYGRADGVVSVARKLLGLADEGPAAAPGQLFGETRAPTFGGRQLKPVDQGAAPLFGETAQDISERARAREAAANQGLPGMDVPTPSEAARTYQPVLGNPSVETTIGAKAAQPVLGADITDRIASMSKKELQDQLAFLDVQIQRTQAELSWRPPERHADIQAMLDKQQLMRRAIMDRLGNTSAARTRAVATPLVAEHRPAVPAEPTPLTEAERNARDDTLAALFDERTPEQIAADAAEAAKADEWLASQSVAPATAGSNAEQELYRVQQELEDLKQQLQERKSKPSWYSRPSNELLAEKGLLGATDEYIQRLLRYIAKEDVSGTLGAHALPESEMEANALLSRWDAKSHMDLRSSRDLKTNIAKTFIMPGNEGMPTRDIQRRIAFLQGNLKHWKEVVNRERASADAEARAAAGRAAVPGEAPVTATHIKGTSARARATPIATTAPTGVKPAAILVEDTGGWRNPLPQPLPTINKPQPAIVGTGAAAPVNPIPGVAQPHLPQPATIPVGQAAKQGFLPGAVKQGHPMVPQNVGVQGPNVGLTGIPPMTPPRPPGQPPLLPPIGSPGSPILPPSRPGMPFAGRLVNAAGAGFGGLAGYADTPDDATPAERLKRVAIGAVLGYTLTRGGRKMFERPSPLARSGIPQVDGLIAMYERQHGGSWIERMLKDPSRLPVDFERKMLDRYVLANKSTEAARLALGIADPKKTPLMIDAEAHIANFAGRHQAGLTWVEEGLSPVFRLMHSDDEAVKFNAMVDLYRAVEVGLLRESRGADVAKLEFAGGIKSVADAQAGIAALEAKVGPDVWNRFQQADALLKAHHNSILDAKVASGIITPEWATLLKAEHPHYSPQMLSDLEESINILGGRNLRVNAHGIRRLSEFGHTEDHLSPLQASIVLTLREKNRIMKNDAVKAWVAAMTLDPQYKGMINIVPNVKLTTGTDIATGVMGTTVAHKQPPVDVPGLISYFDKGERVFVTVPPPVEKLVKTLGADPADLDVFRWTIQKANAVARAGITQRNPIFPAINMQADAMIAMAQGVGPIRLAGGYKSAITGDALMQDFLRGGGGSGGWYGHGEEAASKIEAEVSRQIQHTGGRVVRTMDDAMRLIADTATLKSVEHVGQRVELAPRLAAYQKALQEGQNPARAIMAGRRVTLDFSRFGEWMEGINKYILFSNAAVQGIAQMVRIVRDEPKAVMVFVAGLNAAAVGAYLWNRQFVRPDGKTYLEDIPSYIRDTTLVYIVPGSEYTDEQGNPRIRYGAVPLRQLGIIIAPVNRAMATMDQSDPRGFMQWVGEMASRTVSPIQATSGAGMLGQMLPGPISTSFELAGNMDTWRGFPIVPRGMEDLPAEQQVRPGITSQAAKDIGSVTGWSPIKTDYAAQGMFGGLGQQSMGAYDVASGKSGAPLYESTIGRLLRDRSGQIDRNKAEDYDAAVQDTFARRYQALKQTNAWAQSTPDQQAALTRREHLAAEEDVKAVMVANLPKYAQPDVRSPNAPPEMQRLGLGFTAAPGDISQVPLSVDQRFEMDKALEAEQTQQVQRVLADPRYAALSDADKKATLSQALRDGSISVRIKMAKQLGISLSDAPPKYDRAEFSPDILQRYPDDASFEQAVNAARQQVRDWNKATKEGKDVPAPSNETFELAAIGNAKGATTDEWKRWKFEQDKQAAKRREITNNARTPVGVP
jgi:hypothetical protein